MYHCSFTPYEGDNDYIFVSYAHADAEAVLPILDDLSERGYRVWYDEGIAPGSEWPEFIARHLNGSAIVMYFVSEASVASDNCRREVTFALSKQKGLLAVMLEPVKLPLGLEMQLAAQRCVLRYKYPSEEKFMANVCSMPELMSCRKRQGGRHAAPAASSAAKTNAQSSRHQRERNYAQPKAQSSSKGVVIALLAGLALLSLLGGMLVYALTGQSNNVIETPPPVQTPLQTATPTPILQPAPTPTPAVALTPAPVPVQTPQPTVMPVPTYDPYADQTPFPTAAPIPSFAPEITPMPTPEPTASVDIYVPEMPIETYDPYFPPEPQPDHPTVPEAEIILPGSQEPEGNMQSMEGNFAIA